MKTITLVYDPAHGTQLDLWLPQEPNGNLFINIHGGGLETGVRTWNQETFQTLTEKGVTVASMDYRMYPEVQFPTFIEDCALGIDYMLHKSGYNFSHVYVGGSSAGAYLSMMLLFDTQWLGKYGIDPMALDGWVLDAGQPTTHFRVLKERGLDTRLVRIDEAAPLFFIDHDFTPTRADGKLPMVLNITASHDITCRPEQLRLLHATLLHFGWPEERLQFRFMEGYGHCSYNGEPIFAEMILDMMQASLH